MEDEQKLVHPLCLLQQGIFIIFPALVILTINSKPFMAVGLMIVWFRNLPQLRIDFSEWTPFIQQIWFRKQFMKVVYLLMVIFLLASIWVGVWGSFLAGVTLWIKTPLLMLVLVLVFLTHELLHVLVVYQKGDISLTFSGIFFWLHTNAVLTKKRFWLFMSLPGIVLSAIPALGSFLIQGNSKELLLIICWFNLIISSADILNSVLILVKPNHSLFCRGYYLVKKHNGGDN